MIHTQSEYSHTVLWGIVVSLAIGQLLGTIPAIISVGVFLVILIDMSRAS